MIRGEGTYSDIWAGPYYVQRPVEAREHLERIFKGANGFERIVEVGSGAGGATVALGAYFLGAKISTVDMDPRAAIIAGENGRKHTQVDITTLSTEELKELVGEAKLVVALRTSAKVARFLVEELGVWFRGTLVVSLINETDSEGIGELRRMILHGAIDGRIVPLVEQRGFSEIAFVVYN